MAEELDRPLPLTFDPAVGTEVDHGGRSKVIVAIVSLDSLLVEDPATGERILARLADLRPWTGAAAVKRRKIPDLAELPPDRIETGRQRQEAIERLLAMRNRTKKDVAEAGAALGLKTTTLYNLIRRYESERSLTCLIPHAYRKRRRKKRLQPDQEAVITSAITDVYLKDSGARPIDVVNEVIRRLKRADIKPVAGNTIRERLREMDPKEVDKARLGAAAAGRRHHQVYGSFDEVRWPLQRIQIDHTVADFFVVDPEGRHPVTRPILTLGIDEFSRVVKGFYLSIHRPSTLSVAMALTQGILDKTEFCRRHGLESPYPVCGLEDAILTDNATEFDSRGLQLGCRQWRIQGEFRPLGAPHFGGRIERLIGTMMGEVRLIPGYTFNSIAERGKDYDPSRYSALTIEEAEKRLATMIVDIYHRTQHSALGTTPLKAYEYGILGSDKIPGRGLPRMPSDPTRLFKDFLPVEYRTVQDYGLQINHLRYQSELLRVFASRKGGEKYIVRYDPRNVSVVYFYDPASQEYFDVPLRDSYRPPVALWEVKDAVAELKKLGQDPDDEDAIFRGIERCRQIDAEATAKSKQARRRQERRREDAKAQPPKREVQDVIAAKADLTTASPPAAPTRRARPIPDIEGW